MLQYHLSEILKTHGLITSICYKPASGERDIDDDLRVAQEFKTEKQFILFISQRVLEKVALQLHSCEWFVIPLGAFWLQYTN